MGVIHLIGRPHSGTVRPSFWWLNPARRQLKWTNDLQQQSNLVDAIYAWLEIWCGLKYQKQSNTCFVKNSWSKTIIIYCRPPPFNLSRIWYPMTNSVHSRYLAVTYPHLPKKDSHRLSFMTSKFVQTITFECVVRCAIPCCVVPRYISSVYSIMMKAPKIWSFSATHWYVTRLCSVQHFTTLG